MQRMTRQRLAVLEIMASEEGFHSAQEIHDLLAEAGISIGLATVYRNLTALAQAGELDTIRSPLGELLYRQCKQCVHHHHLVCRRCGATKEISPTKVDQWLSAVGEEQGFSELTHFVEVFGLCPHCSKQTQNDVTVDQ